MVPSQEEETPRMCAHRGKAMWGHSEKVVIYRPRKEALEEIKPAETLVLVLSPPELWADKFLLWSAQTVLFCHDSPSNNLVSPTVGGKHKML